MEAITGLLARNELGLPLWAWVLAGGGAILVTIYLRRRNSGDQSVTGGPTGASVPSSIDPYTGVPYSIESAINPGTGLPAYYGTGSTSGGPGVGGGGISPVYIPPPTPAPGGVDQSYTLAQLIGMGLVPQSYSQYESQYPGSMTLQQWGALYQSQGGSQSGTPPVPTIPGQNWSTGTGFQRPNAMWPGATAFR